MKPFFILIFLQCIVQSSIFAQSTAKSDTTKTLFIIEDNGKYGLMEENGKIWLEAKFDEIVYWTYQESASAALYMKGKHPPNYSRHQFNNRLHHLDNNILFLSAGNRFDHKNDL